MCVHLYYIWIILESHINHISKKGLKHEMINIKKYNNSQKGETTQMPINRVKAKKKSIQIQWNTI